jgi:hypothetical protein
MSAMQMLYFCVSGNEQLDTQKMAKMTKNVSAEQFPQLQRDKSTND